MNSSCNQYTFEEENYPFLSSENEKNESNLYLRSNLVRFIAFNSYQLIKREPPFAATRIKTRFKRLEKWHAERGRREKREEDDARSPYVTA